MNTGNIDPYEVYIGGVKCDPQRICRAYGITDMGIQQAIKKLLRSGLKHKDVATDKREAITSIQRSIEMDAEDARTLPLDNSPVVKHARTMLRPSSAIAGL